MSDSPPEYYTDGVNLGVSPFGATLAFVLQPTGTPGEKPPIGICNVRMSLEHAKTLAMLLKQQLQKFEAQLNAEIPLPDEVYEKLGLNKHEDWS